MTDARRCRCGRTRSSVRLRCARCERRVRVSRFVEGRRPEIVSLALVVSVASIGVALLSVALSLLG